MYAAQHGNGLTPPIRESKARTREVQVATTRRSGRHRKKRGDYVTCLCRPGETLHPLRGVSSPDAKIHTKWGWAVCRTMTNAATTAELSCSAYFVAVGQRSAHGGGSTPKSCHRFQRPARVYYTDETLKRPNWTRDGKNFIFNKRGRLYELL